MEINTFRLFVDGGLAISVSMLMAVLINDYLPLKDVQGQDGVVILAGMLLCPCALLLYGGTRVIFAAYEAHKKKVAKRVEKQVKQRIMEELDKARHHQGEHAISWDEIYDIVRQPPPS